MNTITLRCWWEDDTVRKWIGHTPSYAEANKMKSLMLYIHVCHRSNLRDCSSTETIYLNGSDDDVDEDDEDDDNDGIAVFVHCLNKCYFHLSSIIILK